MLCAGAGRGARKKTKQKPFKKRKKNKLQAKRKYCNHICDKGLHYLEYKDHSQNLKVKKQPMHFEKGQRILLWTDVFPHKFT